MKALRNLLLAAGLVGAGAGGHAALTVPDAVPNDCRAPWTGVRETAPKPLMGAVDSELLNVNLLVCTYPDGTEITFYDNGAVLGTGPNGERLADPEATYEALR